MPCFRIKRCRRKKTISNFLAAKQGSAETKLCAKERLKTHLRKYSLPLLCNRFEILLYRSYCSISCLATHLLEDEDDRLFRLAGTFLPLAVFFAEIAAVPQIEYSGFLFYSEGSAQPPNVRMKPAQDRTWSLPQLWLQRTRQSIRNVITSTYTRLCSPEWKKIIAVHSCQQLRKGFPSRAHLADEVIVLSATPVQRYKVLRTLPGKCDEIVTTSAGLQGKPGLLHSPI